MYKIPNHNFKAKSKPSVVWVLEGYEDRPMGPGRSVTVTVIITIRLLPLDHWA